MERRIYPYLIDSKRISGYYELLLSEGYKLKIFNKKTDEEVYKYFMPVIRQYAFWTFDIPSKKEFEDTPIDLQAPICADYNCNIFEKKNDIVICFKSGICFAITANTKVVAELIKYEEKRKMQEINLREDTSYEIPDNCIDGEYSSAHFYAYILELYKDIFLNKIDKEIQKPEMFDKARNEFVKFTSELYNVKMTDRDLFVSQMDIDLGLDEKIITIEAQFDLMYKNNKLNDKQNVQRIFIGILAVAIVVGVINLINFINIP